jgi:hypothetical protein
MANAR